MNGFERIGSVVVMRCPPHLDMTFVRECTEGFDRELAGVARFAVVVETGSVSRLPGAAERKALVDWMNQPRVRDAQLRLNVGSATVVSNAAMRGVLTALYWVWTPPTPQYPARDLDDATAWAIERLRAERVPLGLPEEELRARLRAQASRVA